MSWLEWMELLSYLVTIIGLPFAIAVCRRSGADDQRSPETAGTPWARNAGRIVAGGGSGALPAAKRRLALVVNADGEWTGILTFDDVLEQIVGKVGDEFDPARAGQFFSLADALTTARIMFQLQARSMSEAIKKIIERIPPGELPRDPQCITQVVLKRELAMPTYIGNGLAVPHGRLHGIDKPILAFARSEEGIPLDATNERAELIFLLLTPSDRPRIQTRMLADIAGLFQSEYVV